MLTGTIVAWKEDLPISRLFSLGRARGVVPSDFSDAWNLHILTPATQARGVSRVITAGTPSNPAARRSSPRIVPSTLVDGWAPMDTPL
jgi:hypothetical protein